MEKKDIQSGQQPVDLDRSQIGRSDIADILRTFSTSASMHGLSKIKAARCTPFRMIWILATLTCSGWLIWQIYREIYLYSQYNKKTLLTVNYDPITFPDVTLCNHRHVDVDILYSLYSQYHLNQGNIDPQQLYQMEHLLNVRPILEHEFFKSQYDYEKTIHKYMNDRFRIITQASLRTVFWSVLNLTYNGLNSLVAPVEELVTGCHWGDEECPSMNIEIKDSYFRKCLTLRQPKSKSIQVGIQNGLSVMSLVGSGMLPLSDIIKNYTVLIKGLSEHDHPLAGADGLRVMIHQQGTPPLPMSEGFTIPPGYMGSLGIKVNRYKRMGPPYGDCIDTDPYGSNPNDTYRLAACLLRCVQHHTIKVCGCRNPTLPADPYTSNKLNCYDFKPVPENCQDNDPPLHCLTPFENLDRNINCTKTIQNQIQAHDQVMRYCGCYPACSEDAYNIAFSLGAWPSLMETDVLWQSKVGPKIHELMSTLNYSDTKKQLFMDHFTTSNRYKAMQDFVKLNVYLSDAAVQETTEEEDYLLINLVADVGGTMGLWVGMSILSLMEVVQLVVDILTTFCKQKRKGCNTDVERGE